MIVHYPHSVPTQIETIIIIQVINFIKWENLKLEIRNTQIGS